MQPGQPVPSRRVGKVTPEHAGTDPRAPALGVDLELVQAGGTQQYGITEVAVERRGAMPRPLRHHAQAGTAGGPQHVGNLFRRSRIGHGRRVMLNLQVPGRARHVVSGVAGKVHGTAAQPAQRRSRSPARRTPGRWSRVSTGRTPHGRNSHRACTPRTCDELEIGHRSLITCLLVELEHDLGTHRAIRWFVQRTAQIRQRAFRRSPVGRDTRCGPEQVDGRLAAAGRA